MLASLVNVLQPAGLVLAGAGLVSLVFSERLAALDDLMKLSLLGGVDPEVSKRWVEVSGAVWGVLGVALLFIGKAL